VGGESIRELMRELGRGMKAAGLQLLCVAGRWTVAYTEKETGIVVGEEADALCAMASGEWVTIYVPGEDPWSPKGFVAILAPEEDRTWPPHATEETERSVAEFLRRALEVCDRLAAFRRL